MWNTDPTKARCYAAGFAAALPARPFGAFPSSPKPTTGGRSGEATSPRRDLILVGVVNAAPSGSISPPKSLLGP